jgi:cytochrome P450
MIAHIYSRPEVLALIRAELDALAGVNNPESALEDDEYVVHAHDLLTTCPIFRSTFYETLRHTGAGFAVRAVDSDLPLDGGAITLEKNSIVFVSGPPINMDPANWRDPATFHAKRFIDIASPEAQMPSMYRGFGGGAAVCMGRQIAVPTCLAAVGRLIAEFDMIPVDGGKWAIPEPKFAHPPEAATPPRGVGNTEVQLMKRQGIENVRFVLCPGENGMVR